MPTPKKSRPSSGHDGRTRPPVGCCYDCWRESGQAVPVPAYDICGRAHRFCGDHLAYYVALGFPVPPLASPDLPPHNPLPRTPAGHCSQCHAAGRKGVRGEVYREDGPPVFRWRLCYPCRLEVESEGRTLRELSDSVRG